MVEGISFVLCLGFANLGIVLQRQLKLWLDSMILTFIKETLFALLLIVSIIVPPIYLGYQITPEFRKKRYIVYLLMMQLIAGKTFFEIMYLEVLIFFYLIFYVNRKKKGESLFLSFYLFSFYQSIRYLLVLFYIRMLDIDMLSELGNGIVNSFFLY